MIQINIDTIRLADIVEDEQGKTLQFRFTREGSSDIEELHIRVSPRGAVYLRESVGQALGGSRDSFGLQPIPPELRYAAQQWMLRAIKEEATPLLQELGFVCENVSTLGSARFLRVTVAPDRQRVFPFEIEEVSWWIPATRAHARVIAEEIVRKVREELVED